MTINVKAMGLRGVDAGGDSNECANNSSNKLKYLFRHFGAILAMVGMPQTTPLEVGLRVIRGPDWKWEEQDGGEGGVGTVVEVGTGAPKGAKEGSSPSTPDKTVIVQWDGGTRTNYRVGHQDGFDLLTLDSGPCGIRHPEGVICASCGTAGFFGLRWHCADCDAGMGTAGVAEAPAGARTKAGTGAGVDLCSECYGAGAHNLRHRFRRFDSPSSPGTFLAPPRAESRRLALRGIFIGAMVQRSFDWVWGDQDGGRRCEGEVVAVKGWEEETGRSVVTVIWEGNQGAGRTNHYRLGHKGKLDVQLARGHQGAPGGHCYPDHLPVPGKQEPVNFSPKHSREFTLRKFDVGDRVRVCVDAEVLRTLQEGHGGFHAKMADLVGVCGRVHRITAAGDIRVQYPGKPEADHRWTVHPAALAKAPPFGVGDLVQVLEDETKVRLLQANHWSEDMRTALGGTARVIKTERFGGEVGQEEVEVQTQSGATFTFKPGCLTTLSRSELVTGGRGETPSPAASQLFPRRQMSDGDGGIVQAASRGEAWQVAEMLRTRRRPDPAMVRKAMLVASKHARLDVLKLLADRFPEEVNGGAEGARRKTALHVAVYHGHLDAVDLLLRAGASLGVRDADGDTALHYAVYACQATVVRFLLEHEAPPNAANEKGKTALHVAVALEDEGCASAILEGGGDTNLCDALGNTPFHEAAAKDASASFCQLLHSFRGNPAIRNKKGFNSAHLAAMKGSAVALEAILDLDPSLGHSAKADGIAPMHLACLNGRVEASKVILRKGGEDLVMARDKTGRTPLHHACARGFYAIAEMLLHNGAGANAAARDFEGVTPLHIVLDPEMQGQKHLASDKSSSSGASNSGGAARVDQAVANRVEAAGVPESLRDQVALATLLVLNGADATVPDREGRTAFDLVRNPETRAFLLELSLQNHSKEGVEEGAAGAVVRKQAGGSTRKREGSLCSEECQVCSEICVPVVFRPCGHKVACGECAVRMKKCLVCKETIEEKVVQEEEEEEENDCVGGERRKGEKGKVLELEAKVRDLEEGSLCLICMERKRNVAFLCGHQACSECGESLSSCHMCRQPVGRKIYLY